MGYTKDDLKKTVDALTRQRDELNVKMHLAKAEVRDEIATVREEAEKTTETVTTATGLLADEIKKGYERIKNAL
jgi:preprotein translocase subunit Sec63